MTLIKAVCMIHHKQKSRNRYNKHHSRHGEINTFVISVPTLDSRIHRREDGLCFLRYYRTDDRYLCKSVARVQSLNADCDNCTAFRIRTLDDHIAFLLIHCRYSVLRKNALMVDPFFGKIYRTVSTYRTHAFRHITATVVLVEIILHL